MPKTSESAVRPTSIAVPKMIPITGHLIEPARVRVSMGITMNTGNFNSARIDIDVTRNCEDSQKAIDKMRKELVDEAKKFLKSESAKIKHDIENYTVL